MMQEVANELRAPGAQLESVELPAPTAWPMVLALGLGLSIMGMVTSPYVTGVGLILFVMSAVGWFRQVLPHEHHEAVEVTEIAPEIGRSSRQIERLTDSSAHAQVKPIKTFSLVSGLVGGMAGGTAMIVPAVLYGVVRYHSPWYAVNLLAAGGFPSWATASNAFFAEFHWKGLIAAIIIHTLTCPLVGLLYAAGLPMFPRRPILTAGFVVPLFWSLLLYGVLGLVSPVLNQRIDWAWFIPSQLAFGLVTGYVVNRSVRVRSAAFRELPFAVRAGLHTDAHPRDENDGGQR